MVKMFLSTIDKGGLDDETRTESSTSVEPRKGPRVFKGSSGVSMRFD